MSIITFAGRTFAIVAILILLAGPSLAQAQDKATLTSKELEVDVALDSPRVLAYRLQATGGQILGSLGKGTPSVVVSKRGGQKVTADWKALAPKMTQSADSVVFACTAKVGETVAATFDYAIRLKDNVVTIQMENVKESDGYDLNEWLFPADPLIRVTADMPGAKACVGDLGASGLIAKAGDKLPGQAHFGLLFTDKAAAGIYSNSFYRQGNKPVHMLVSEGATGLLANHHRYSYKDENFEPFFCKIGIVADVNGDKAVDWKDAACFIHDSIPNHVKLRQEYTKYMLNHGTDFESAPDDVLRKLCNISDGHPQMVLLSAWNGWGWDSEYPTWNVPGEEYGGREGLYKLHENAHKYRAYTSMIHNFDDAYKMTRAWDDSLIARRGDGSLVDATWWSGGPSYIIGPYRFWKSGKMKEWVDGLISQGEEVQIFSDVFTMIPWRNDEDPKDPADPETNLVIGKFRLLEYLASHDIYMNSEGFNYEMLGRYIGAHNGYNGGITSDPARPPLAWFICHGLLAKKMGGPNDEGLFRGEDTETTAPFVPGNLYRWSMLLSFYGDKPVTDFRITPDGYAARFGDNVEVLWRQGGGNATSQPAGPRGARGARGGRGGGGQNVSVSLDGSLIADGQSVLLPKNDLGKENMWNVLRAFSATGQPMRYPRPKNWTDISKLTVMAVTFDNPPQVISGAPQYKTGPKPEDLAAVKTEVKDGKIVITATAKDSTPSVLAEVAFEGNDLVIKIPQNQPIKLVYGQDLVAKETTFEPLPPRRPITYPLEKVLDRVGGTERPAWIRLKTRRQLPALDDGAVRCIGASAVWPTREEATAHAAAIVAKKIAWNVRGKYVTGTREYEKALGATTDKLGYDNWNLGWAGAIKLFSLGKVNAHAGVQWYWEKVLAGPEQKEGWKAFVCVPVTPEDCHQVYVESAKDRLQQCQDELKKNTGGQKSRLELNIQVYQKLLQEEPKKAHQKVEFQV